MKWIAKKSGVLTTFTLLLIGGMFIGACSTVSFVPPTPTATPTNTPTVPATPPTLGSGVIELTLADFKPQDGNTDDGIDILDEYFFDSFKAILPVKDGVNLSNYDLEFTFQGGDGKKVQLWYKNLGWQNVYSCEDKITSNQPIRFNPVIDCKAVNQFDDFTHIRAIGAKVLEGVEGVEIISARLIDRTVSP